MPASTHATFACEMRSAAESRLGTPRNRPALAAKKTARLRMLLRRVRDCAAIAAALSSGVARCSAIAPPLPILRILFAFPYTSVHAVHHASLISALRQAICLTGGLIR